MFIQHIQISVKFVQIENVYVRNAAADSVLIMAYYIKYAVKVKQLTK